MNKWKYDTKEWEDFANFVVGASFVMCIIYVGVGIGMMILNALGVVIIK